ncbi:conserved hypothetical protein [Trichinella spiralis]|uniref:hypothetical protein n=1 Tax=Trichinella spiralis TaxID=6334 RepID=UPI0001EFC564|nr:conserved hypothetical protein [Trichinella spiralis]
MFLCIAEVAESNRGDALEAFQGFGNLEMTWFSSIVGLDFYVPPLTVGSCTPLLKGHIGTTTVYKCTSQQHSKLFLFLAFIAVLHASDLSSRSRSRHSIL